MLNEMLKNLSYFFWNMKSDGARLIDVLHYYLQDIFNLLPDNDENTIIFRTMQHCSAYLQGVSPSPNYYFHG